MAVPEDRLKLDGYPGTGEIGSLRLVLYPSTWRFFMMGLHVPMLVEGAWPTATQVMQRGFILREKTRDELAALLDVGCPPSDFAEWCPLFREALISRHWPTPCVNVVSPAIELGSLEAPALQEGVFAGVDTAAMAEPTSCADVHNNAFVDSEDFPTHANNQLGLRKLLSRIAKDLAALPTQIAAQYWRQIVTSAGWECSCARQKETRVSPTRQAGVHGWRRAIDPATGRPYYYNTATGKSQWQRPSITPQQAAQTVQQQPSVTPQQVAQSVQQRTSTTPQRVAQAVQQQQQRRLRPQEVSEEAAGARSIGVAEAPLGAAAEVAVDARVVEESEESEEKMLSESALASEMEVEAEVDERDETEVGEELEAVTEADDDVEMEEVEEEALEA
uniref:WW domain-containing protein n=1 Tax=Haptolina ericina TaxID=156174 RepID=A0A7S3B9J2_9EUKA